MRFLAVIVVVLAVSGCFGHHKAENISPVVQRTLEPNLVIRHERMSEPAEDRSEEQPEVRVSPEKYKLDLESGGGGYVIKLSNGRKVFLSYNSCPFGEYDPEDKSFAISELLTETVDELPGWRLPDESENKLLDEACAVFKVKDELPYACIHGTWSRPESEENFVPVINRGGFIELKRAEDTSGLMLVEDQS